MDLMKCDLRESVLLIEFGDPASRNSFSVRAAEELRSVLANHVGKYNSIVFTSPGRIFCSGGNLSDYATMASAEDGWDVNRKITSILDELARLDVPSVCVVTGDCFGGGIELLGAFDLVLASPGVLFGFWQRRIGLTFGWGGGRRLERRVGMSALIGRALSTDTFGAAEALRIGLVDEIHADTVIHAEAFRRAQSLQRWAKNPVGPLKSWATEREQEIFESLWWNDEHRAALSSRNKK